MPRKQRAPRKLTLSDVEISIEIEAETIPVRGNFDSGDADADRELENEILGLLDCGYTEAWCCIVVKARWKGFEGIDSLGGCSHLIRDDLPSLDKQVEQTIECHQMRENALADLNREIAEAHAKLTSLEAS